VVLDDEQRKVVALLPDSPREIQRLSLPRKRQNLAGGLFFLDLNGQIDIGQVAWPPSVNKKSGDLDGSPSRAFDGRTSLP
jgi:hypothetical protein